MSGEKSTRVDALFESEFQLRLAAEAFATNKSETTRRNLRHVAVAYAAIAKAIR